MILTPTRGCAVSAMLLFFSVLLVLGTEIPVRAVEAPLSQEVRVPFDNLSESIDQALQQEKDLLANYTKELERLKEHERIYTSELSAMKVQFSVYSNLVIMPETQVKSLEQAFAGNLSVLNVIQAARADLKEKRDRVTGLLAQTEEQITLNLNQLSVIRSEKKNQARDSLKLVEKLSRLVDLLNKKKTALTELEATYKDFATQYADMEKEFSALSATFNREISKRIKQGLLQRKRNPLFTKSAKDMISDVNTLLNVPQKVASPDYWAGKWAVPQSHDTSGLVIIALLSVFLQYLLFKGNQGLRKLAASPFVQASVWASLLRDLVANSLFLAANLLFISICDYFFHIRLRYPLVEMAEQVLTVILLTRWCLDALNRIPLSGEGFASAKVINRVASMARIIRYGTISYVVCLWLVEPDNALFVILRMGLALLFTLELRRLRPHMASCALESSLPSGAKSLLCAIPATGYVALFSGLILDLSGFTSLALYLAVSLGKTLIAVLWSWLLYKVLMDYKRSGKTEADIPADDSGIRPLNTHWFSTLGFFLAWFLLSLVSVIYVWGGKQAVIQGIYTWYTTPVTVGSMKFSLMGFTVALMFLGLTHVVARAWRDLFQKRLFKDSGMDIGVQDSITTISVYVIWIVGILLALNVFGLNMTSITVVLGALGIGIGFGLQNIFNNFLSGIILLFERPIQVGDDVEINGTWASVRKINVRSTVVQTYDNATLIIPNSDFISTQVTNWSFKDKRIRRNVTVGVAYGSDLERVRTSLLETADKTPRVLKLPKPDVVFRDFGDNSLIFTLRFWTRVEYFYSVESAVRFEIDRVFRERNIEISFPQRDLHIRSVDAGLVFHHKGEEKK